MTTVPERLVVLLADDDRNDLFLLQRAFKRIGSIGRLVVVPDGETVLSYLKGEDQYAYRQAWPMPRLVVLDRWMPKMSGLEVLRWLRADARFVSLPVVLLSGCLSSDEGALTQQLRAAYCVKTPDSKSLLTGFQRAMSEALERAWATPSATRWVSAGATTMTLTNRTECNQVRA